MTRVVLVAAAVIVPASASAWHHLPRADYTVVVPDVVYRDGVSGDVALTVYVNEDLPCARGFRTFFAIHGYVHSAATWEPFAEALFDNPTGFPACRVVAIDLPGHGHSAVPAGLPYSELSLQDYVTAIQSALEALPARGLRPRSLIGHSQGALLIQMLQQRLVDAGTSLRRSFGVVKTHLLAPTSPEGVPWQFVDTGAHLQLLEQFLDEDQGIVVIPEIAWPFIFFANLSGIPSPDTPDLTGYASPEPLLSSLELTGTEPIPARPDVNEGVFADRGLFTLFHGTFVSVTAFEQDLLVAPRDAAAVYDHLAATCNRRRFVEVRGELAVHDFYISNPAELLEAVAGTIVF